ncbi:basic proline-rich protein-like [Apus apus]|uniref:basic proline-rich protein-like n=1 Tax=Apus apus TaxID=8895 RepID=UPI0021F8985E|nr:basic proline-rich protein-like [Apus apus]
MPAASPSPAPFKVPQQTTPARSPVQGPPSQSNPQIPPGSGGGTPFPSRWAHPRQGVSRPIPGRAAISGDPAGQLPNPPPPAFPAPPNQAAAHAGSCSPRPASPTPRPTSPPHYASRGRPGPALAQLGQDTKIFHSTCALASPARPGAAHGGEHAPRPGARRAAAPFLPASPSRQGRGGASPPPRQPSPSPPSCGTELGGPQAPCLAVVPPPLPLPVPVPLGGARRGRKQGPQRSLSTEEGKVPQKGELLEPRSRRGTAATPEARRREVGVQHPRLRSPFPLPTPPQPPPERNPRLDIPLQANERSRGAAGPPSAGPPCTEEKGLLRRERGWRRPAQPQQAPLLSPGFSPPPRARGDWIHRTGRQNTRATSPPVPATAPGPSDSPRSCRGSAAPHPGTPPIGLGCQNKMVNWGIAKHPRPNDFHTPPSAPLEAPSIPPRARQPHGGSAAGEIASAGRSGGLWSSLRPSPQRGCGLGGRHPARERGGGGKHPRPHLLRPRLQGRRRLPGSAGTASGARALRASLCPAPSPPRSYPRRCVYLRGAGPGTAARARGGDGRRAVGTRVPMPVAACAASPRPAGPPAAARALAPTEPTHGKLSPLATPRRDPRSRPA